MGEEAGGVRERGGRRELGRGGRGEGGGNYGE